MEKILMIFYNDGVEVKGQKYDKKRTIDFLREQRKTTKTKVKVNCKKNYSIYKMKTDKDVIEIVFPYMYSEENDKYEKWLDMWVNYDKRGFFLRLKILGIVLGIGATGALACKAYSQIEEKYGSISKFIQIVDDEIDFYITNIGELNDIKILEDELRDHTGYGEIEGYEHTIEDHLNSFCYLDHADTYSKMDKEIFEFCDKNGLGEEVYKNAMKKYEYYLKEDLGSAHDIQLKKIYKEEMMRPKQMEN